jgi:Lipocalin-like domain
MMRMLAVLIGITVHSATAVAQSSALVGAWTLVAADVIRPDGRTDADYGAAPRGIAVFTPDGHYVVEIYRAERMKFGSSDKSRGTAEEYKDATLAISTHFGRYTLDASKGTISFMIASASFPNLDGTTQVRPFTLVGDTLAWRVPPRPDGSVPVTRFVRLR